MSKVSVAVVVALIVVAVCGGLAKLGADRARAAAKAQAVAMAEIMAQTQAKAAAEAKATEEAKAAEAAKAMPPEGELPTYSEAMKANPPGKGDLDLRRGLLSRVGIESAQEGRNGGVEYVLSKDSQVAFLGDRLQIECRGRQATVLNPVTIRDVKYQRGDKLAHTGKGWVKVRSWD